MSALFKPVRFGMALAAFLLVPVASRSIEAADERRAPEVSPAVWDRFRGPNGSGVSDAKGIPVAWTDGDYKWTVDLPGKGISSPVVWNDKIFLASADEAKLERYLLCLSTADGKELWRRGVSYPKEKKHLHNSYATSTPAVDAERVYHVWQQKASSQLVAFDHSGKPLWTCELGPYGSGHGGGISPVVVDGIVALNYVQEAESRLIGVDAATGRERWSIPRKKGKANYSSPCVIGAADGRKTLVFTSYAHGMTCVDPASGAILWERDTFDSDDGEQKRSIGSPLVSGGVVFGNCAFVGGKKIMAALRPTGAKGDDAVEEVFRLERNVNHMPTALVYDGRLYMWTDGGILVCAKADTGKILYQERLGGNFSGSPVCIDGKLYCMSEDGELVVTATGDKFEELGRVKLPEGSSSTPAVAGGVVYLRTFSKLLALGPK
jgi:outer membrane protein assembly factor BamB